MPVQQEQFAVAQAVPVIPLEAPQVVRVRFLPNGGTVEVQQPDGLIDVTTFPCRLGQIHLGVVQMPLAHFRLPQCVIGTQIGFLACGFFLVGQCGVHLGQFNRFHSFPLGVGRFIVGFLACRLFLLSQRGVGIGELQCLRVFTLGGFCFCVGPLRRVVRSRLFVAFTVGQVFEAHGRNCGDHRHCNQQQRGSRDQRRQGGVSSAPADQSFGAADRAGRDRFSARPALQVVGQVAGGGVASGGRFRERLQTDRFRVAINRRVELSRCNRLLFEHLPERLHRRRRLEGRAAGEEFIEDRSQRVDVGRGTKLGGPARSLLWRHVAGRSQNGTGLSLPRFVLQSFRQTKVADLGQAIGGQQHIGRFQIAVEDAAIVSGLHGAGEDLNNPCRVMRWQRCAVGMFLEAASLQILQRHERQAVMLANGVNLHDVRVLQAGDRFGLDAEPGEIVLAGVCPGADHLDRDQTLQPHVAGFVNDAHPALPQHAKHLVSRQLRKRATVRCISDRSRKIPGGRQSVRADFRILLGGRTHNGARDGRHLGDHGLVFGESLPVLLDGRSFTGKLAILPFDAQQFPQ